MELYEKILYEVITKEIIPGIQIDGVQLVESRCYRAIEEIYKVVADDTVDDPECFARIEAIVCALERLGIGGGGRHDF